MRPKKKKPLSESTKRKISETLSGQKIGGQISKIDQEAGLELQNKLRQGDNFKYQALVDWWRNLKS